ncbi:hypothetical protein FEZ63_23810 [Microvirga brassicacearum]|uniref:Uncharacterized protein n=1 Tax=Microvirga brassicacearum TaxID=2580413 RepID=A0A5N3P3M9_9HYPH|nr:hypothetical protein FEZ63_23810 [Microvirga brassicacearum]
MQRRLSLPILVASAAMLSACNTSDYYYYSTGPWGPRSVYRAYPEYDAPWGGPSFATAEIPPLYIDGGGVDPSVRRVPVPAGRFEVLLPPDPVPPGPAPWQYGSRTNDARQDAQSTVSPTPSLSQKMAHSSAPASPVVSAPTRAFAYAGSWKAVDGKGASCKINLSSAPSLDHYKASASGCSDSDLKSVNSWSFGNTEVILYARGKVVAQLSGQEANLEGALAGSRRSLKMTR